MIPEATPRQLVNRSFDIGKRDHSPKRAGARSSLVRTAFPASINQARVYPEDKEGAALMDAAAGFWGGITSSSTHHHTGGELAINRGGDEARFSSDPHAQSPQTPDAEVGANGRSGEGGIMPFDMDVPVAYGSVTAGNMATIQLGITDITSGSLVSKVEEVDPVSVGRDSTSIMENIETERVPCPRLCGATFGSGNGGLVIFHNGEVRKMWSWYQRTDNIRFSGVPGGKGDIASDPDNLRMVHNTRTSHPLSSEVDGSTKQNEPAASSLPRTLKELINMITTSKEVRNEKWRFFESIVFPTYAFLYVNLLGTMGRTKWI